MNLRLIGLSTLSGLAITAGIGAASNRVSSTPARRVACSQTPRRATLDRERLRKAIWMRESSGQEYPEAGDDGKSIGPYQVKYARFCEYRLPVERYRHMTPTQWHAWMRRAISGYLRDCPKSATVEQRVAFAGRGHNGGKRRTTHNSYTRSLWKFYQKGKP